MPDDRPELGSPQVPARADVSFWSVLWRKLIFYTLLGAGTGVLLQTVPSMMFLTAGRADAEILHISPAPRSLLCSRHSWELLVSTPSGQARTRICHDPESYRGLLPVRYRTGRDGKAEARLAAQVLSGSDIPMILTLSSLLGGIFGLKAALYAWRRRD